MGIRKYTFEQLKQIINNLGYELISETYPTRTEKVILKDHDGYYSTILLTKLEKGIIPPRFHKSNPYTIQNIALWCKLNNKNFKLIDNQIYEGSHNDLEWQCLKETCGEIFKSTWGNIQGKNYGCSICSGQEVSLSNCLATKNPKLASEWHPTKNGDLTSYNVTINSNKKVWWLCSKNPKHEWITTISHRGSRNSKCPYCSHKLPSEDYNLLIINPTLCQEWNYQKNHKNPEDYCPNSDDKVWWICKHNHEWFASIGSRNKGSNCPYCSGRYASENYNLLMSNPEVSKEWNYKRNKKSPKEYTPASNQYVWWLCNKCGHEWEAIIGNRSKLNRGCPKCNESKGEIQIRDCLNKYNISYFSQKEFDGLLGIGRKNLSYDFYLPQHNLLIEFQGEQHEKYKPGFHCSKKDFEKQQEHDRRKREYAIKNNFTLLEIWYWDFDNIEKILSKCFKELSLLDSSFSMK